MVAKFDLGTISRTNSYLLFLACCVVIVVASYLLQKVHDSIMSFLKVSFQSKRVEGI